MLKSCHNQGGSTRQNPRKSQKYVADQPYAAQFIMNNLKKLIIMLLCVSAWALSFSATADAATKGTAFSAGSYSFSYSGASSVTLRINGTSAQTPIKIDGTLHMRIYSADAKTVRAGFMLNPVTVSEGYAENSELEKLYSSVILADMASNGRFISFRMPEELSQANMNTLKGLLTSMETVFSGKRAYTATQTDALGTYKASYSTYRGTLRKSKRRYTYISSSFFDYDNVKASPAKYSCSIVPASDGGWVNSIKIKENLDLASGTDKFLSAIFSVSLTRLTDRQDIADPLPESYEDAEKMLKVDHSGNRLISQSTPDADIITKLGNTGEKEASMIFTEFIKTHPGYASTLPALIKSGNLTDQQKAAVITCTGQAGTSAAQNALISVIKDSDQTADIRLLAASAIALITEPLTEDNAAYVTSLGSQASADATKIASTALLSAGSSLQNISEKYPEDAKALSYRLTTALRTADAANAPFFIQALGNTAMPENADALIPYLDDPSQKIRAAAAVALKFIPGDKSSEALASCLNSDFSEYVRAVAAEAMTDRTLDKTAIASVIRASRDENDLTVRRLIIKILAVHKDDRNVSNALKTMLVTEKSRDNIREIIKALK